MRLLTVQHALPSREVTNDQLIAGVLARANGTLTHGDGARLERAMRGFFQRAGSRTRFHRAPGERALDFGLDAARRALAAAQARPEDIDLLIYVGVGRGFLEPATANVFQAMLGLHRATCFDVLDACASWLRGVDVARHMIRGGAAKLVMILNCEFNFEEYIRWDVRTPADLERLGAGFTIGEAATATILSDDDPDDDYRAAFRTCGEHYPLCQIPLPHAAQFVPLSEGANGAAQPLRFFAHARGLHVAALEQIESLFRSDPRWAAECPDHLFGHATSVPASREVLVRLRLDPARHVDLFPMFGNTVSAAVPLAISLAIEDGRLHRGQSAMIVMGSAGLTTALCRLRY